MNDIKKYPKYKRNEIIYSEKGYYIGTLILVDELTGEYNPYSR